MRRVALAGSEGDDPKNVVVISYVPLLAGEPGRVLSVGDEEFNRLMAEADRCPSGLADACLGVADNGGVFPAFVLPQAHAIAEHLLAWAEGRPGDWFALCFAQRRGRYVAALFPNLVGSVDRFEAAHLVRNGQPSKAAGYELLFRPIAFVSGVHHTFKRVKKLIAGQSVVGFMEPCDFDPTTPSSLKPERILQVGPFMVCWDAKPFGMSIEAVLSQLVASASAPESN
jgi:hypothetical protein